MFQYGGDFMTVNIENALKIDGWMSTRELTWLAQQAQKHLSILEIGSYKGRSTRALAENTHGKVRAVDIWKMSSFREFYSNMVGLNNFSIVKAPSEDALEILRGHRFDMIFIDADHSYEAVKADIITGDQDWSQVGSFAGMTTEASAILT
jgi:predicted O-methyltransferase YrrM